MIHNWADTRGLIQRITTAVSPVQERGQESPVTLSGGVSRRRWESGMQRHRPYWALRIAGLAVLVPLLIATPGRAQGGSVAMQDPDDPSDLAPAPSTWKGAFADSLRLLALEHTARVAFQAKTRRELGGPFFSDYARSVRIPDTWEDGDSWGVNYIGHPIHGAASGFIWLDHEDGAHDPKLGFSREYWASRGRATAWAALYSLQFEFGPLSEASIGNVGLRPSTTGWVDHVVTPAGALGFMVAEDIVDRSLIAKIESWTRSCVIWAARTALNPSRSLSNSVQGRTPWPQPVRFLR
jgi:hypothetical protein